MARKGSRSDAADTLRGAVDRTVQATVGSAQLTRERAQELVDELAQSAGRVRDALEELRVPVPGDEVRALRARVDELEKRIAVLEKGRAKRATAGGAKRSTAKGAKRSASGGGAAKRSTSRRKGS